MVAPEDGGEYSNLVLLYIVYIQYIVYLFKVGDCLVDEPNQVGPEECVVPLGVGVTLSSHLFQYLDCREVPLLELEFGVDDPDDYEGRIDE